METAANCTTSPTVVVTGCEVVHGRYLIIVVPVEPKFGHKREMRDECDKIMQVALMRARGDSSIRAFSVRLVTH